MSQAMTVSLVEPLRDGIVHTTFLVAVIADLVEFQIERGLMLAVLAVTSPSGGNGAVLQKSRLRLVGHKILLLAGV